MTQPAKLTDVFHLLQKPGLVETKDSANTKPSTLVAEH